MTILVTGAAGFIGSNLTDLLLRHGHRVVGIDNFHPHYPKKIKERNLSKARMAGPFKFFEASVLDSDTMLQILEETRPDKVVHLAAEVGSRHSSRHAQPFYRTNIEGTHVLLDLCSTSSVRRFIMASTSTVYADSLNEPLQEDSSPIDPGTPYGISKLANEAMCRACSRTTDMDVTVLRIFSTYGPRQRPDLALHRFMRLVAEGRPIEVFAPDESIRDYVHVSDCVQAIRAALNYRSKFDIVNIGSGQGIRIAQLIRTLEDVMRRRATVTYLSPHTAEPKGGVACIDKAHSCFAYRPRFDFYRGVEDFYNWFSSRKRGKDV